MPLFLSFPLSKSLFPLPFQHGIYEYFNVPLPPPRINTHTHTYTDCIICKQSELWFPLLLRATRRDNEIPKRFLRPLSLARLIIRLIFSSWPCTRFAWRRRRGGEGRGLISSWRFFAYDKWLVYRSSVITLKVAHKRVVVSRMILHSPGYVILYQPLESTHYGNYTAWGSYIHTLLLSINVTEWVAEFLRIIISIDA